MKADRRFTVNTHNYYVGWTRPPVRGKNGFAMSFWDPKVFIRGPSSSVALLHP
jgi:hypothetical protein